MALSVKGAREAYPPQVTWNVVDRDTPRRQGARGAQSRLGLSAPDDRGQWTLQSRRPTYIRMIRLRLPGVAIFGIESCQLTLVDEVFVRRTVRAAELVPIEERGVAPLDSTMRIPSVINLSHVAAAAYAGSKPRRGRYAATHGSGRPLRRSSCGTHRPRAARAVEGLGLAPWA